MDDETRCVGCGRRLSDIQVCRCEDFCSDDCRDEWQEAVRGNAEADALEWGVSGPPDTDALDPPPWAYR